MYAIDHVYTLGAEKVDNDDTSILCAATQEPSISQSTKSCDYHRYFVE